jgi:protein-L-isoaspartate(D-aspartate) O-methyltransferase
MDRKSELAIVRRAFAKQLSFAARLTDPRIEAAFAAVPREQFLGPGPWQMFRFPNHYITTPDCDPTLLYVDQVFAIEPERFLNNGQPLLHAMLLGFAQIKAGEHVVHVGAGTGYYTAIMAELAGPGGRVTAIEFDPTIAARARQYLAGTSRVTLLEGDGARLPLDTADVIYVNAGVTHPADNWLNALSEGGRLILPLTTDQNFSVSNPTAADLKQMMESGAFFRITRRGAGFEARGLLPTAIIPADGMRDKAAEAALAAAFKKGGWNQVTRLVRGESVPDERCWVRGDDWCLTYS